MVRRLHEGSSGRQKGLEYLAGLAIGHVEFALEHPALFRLMSTGPISQSLDAQGNLPEIFNEGYQLMLSGLAAAPLKHFGSGERQLDAPIAWAQIYGISNLLIEGRISPETLASIMWNSLSVRSSGISFTFNATGCLTIRLIALPGQLIS